MPKLHYSKAKGVGARNVYVAQNRLGYSSAIALGDAVRANIVFNEEYRAKQGVCRTLVWAGNPVPEEWQQMPPDEVTKLMIGAGYKSIGRSMDNAMGRYKPKGFLSAGTLYPKKA